MDIRAPSPVTLPSPARERTPVVLQTPPVSPPLALQAPKAVEHAGTARHDMHAPSDSHRQAVQVASERMAITEAPTVAFADAGSIPGVDLPGASSGQDEAPVLPLPGSSATPRDSQAEGAVAAGGQAQGSSGAQQSSDAAAAQPSERSHASEAQDDGEISNPGELEAGEKREVRRLRARDAEVRRHEQAHAGAGGQYAGAPRYEFERGPDGRMYAVGGSVSIDVSPEPDPEATIRKMQQVRRAALAPAEPSAQDRRVAARANQEIVKARVQVRAELAESMREDGAAQSGNDAALTAAPEPQQRAEQAGANRGLSGLEPQGQAGEASGLSSSVRQSAADNTAAANVVSTFNAPSAPPIKSTMGALDGLSNTTVIAHMDSTQRQVNLYQEVESSQPQTDNRFEMLA
ncbi:MAG: putative metalloprotease CJM1_0395 family protein [Polyangiales bacterium]